MLKHFILFICTFAVIPLCAQQFELKTIETDDLQHFIGFSSFSDKNIPIGSNEDSGESVTAYFFNPDFSLRKSVTVTPTINGVKGTFWVDWTECGDRLGSIFYASQHLFNSDDLFEFVVYGHVPNGTDENGYELQLWNYFVYNENGELLGSIPDNMIYPLNGECYFKDNYDGKLIFYKVVPNGSGSGSSPIYAHAKLKISPNPVMASEPIQISFNKPTSQGCNITIIGSDGRLVLKRNLASDVNTIEIDSSSLARGVNIINLMQGTRVLEMEKIIVY